jgi:hypothetical protein
MLSLPIWFVIIPLYAVAHMDQFSWGSTRRVVQESSQSKS